MKKNNYNHHQLHEPLSEDPKEEDEEIPAAHLSNTTLSSNSYRVGYSPGAYGCIEYHPQVRHPSDFKIFIS